MFTGNEDHAITLEAAAKLTKNYRDTLSSSTDTIAHYFGEKAILEILAQPNCVGIRIYYGLDDSGKKELVTVGVDANKNDLYQGKIADRTFKCPQDCSSANPLNTSLT